MRAWVNPAARARRYAREAERRRSNNERGSDDQTVSPFSSWLFQTLGHFTRAMNGAGAEDDERVRVDNMWTAEELDALHDPILVPAKLLVPTQVVRRSSTEPNLSRKAEEALQRAKDVFDNYLAHAEYAPPLADLISHDIDDYKKAAGEGFSLYILRRPLPKDIEDMRKQRGHWLNLAQWPQYDSFTRRLISDGDIKDAAFYPLIDFKLTADAAKLFAEHVSIWPGCFARYRGKVNPTDVVVSREGYLAHRTGNVAEPTPSQKEYMDQCAGKVALGSPRWGMRKPQYVEYLRHNRVEFEAKKGIPGHIRFGDPAKATDTDKQPAESKPAKEEAPKKVNLWSSNFLKQNQEHQKKVQDAIDEMEKIEPWERSTKPAPSPLTASTASSPFSFGLKDDKPASTAASSAPPAFTFGKKPPAAPAAAPSFDFLFGNGSPFDGAEKSKDDKPAEEEAPKKVTSTRWCSLNDVMGKLDAIEQKLDLLLGTKQNQ